MLGATLDLGPLRRLVEPINSGLEVRVGGRREVWSVGVQVVRQGRRLGQGGGACT